MADGNRARIVLDAEDRTAAAFRAVSGHVSGLGRELTALPGKFAAIAVATAGLGSIAGFANMVSDSIEARARLQDLSVQSNITVQALAGLGKVGKYANTGLEEIVSASNKLSKALFTPGEEDKGVPAAIKSLGLEFDKFRALQPEQQMLAVAKAMENFQDGAGKSAVSMILFGKTGAQFQTFLKELAERGLPQVSEQLAEQARLAKVYEDNLVTLRSAAEEWKRSVLEVMLPVLVEFTGKLIDGKAAYGSWFEYITASVKENPFANLSEQLRDAREDLDKFEAGLKKKREAGGVTGFLYEVFGGTDANGEGQRERKNRLDYFKRQQMREALALLGTNFQDDPKFRPRKPVLTPGDPRDKDARATLKKEFDGQLKLIADFAEQQKQGYEFANTYLKGVYEDGVTTLADFHEKQKAVRAAALQSQLDMFDKEIAAAQAYRSKVSKPQEIQDADNKIAEARLKRASAVQKASQADILAAQEEARATRQLTDAYNDLQATVLQLQGDQAGASALRIAKQVRDAQELLTKNGSARAKEQATAYGQLLTTTEALSRAQADYARLVEFAGIAEKNALLDAEAAGASELETLTKVASIRQDSLGALSELVVKARELAAALGTPDARLFAEKLALQFKQAAAEADPVLMKIRDIGKEAGTSIASNAEEAIFKWEGARKLLLAIEQDILRIATRKGFTEPFGNYLGNVFGGNGQSGGGGGIIGGLLRGLGLGGGGGGGAVNLGTATGADLDLFYAGMFADGGTLKPGQWGIAGENGPEPIYAGAVPLHVTPNAGRSISLSQQFVISGPMDRRSQDQIAAAAMAGAQRALRRND